MELIKELELLFLCRSAYLKYDVNAALLMYLKTFFLPYHPDKYAALITVTTTRIWNKCYY